MKKGIRYAIIGFILIIFITGCSNKKSNLKNTKIFIDSSVVNTCSIEGIDLQYQIRAFSNEKIEKSVINIEANEGKMKVKESNLTLSEQIDGIYAYFLNITVLPETKELEYYINFNANEQNFSINNLKNKLFKSDVNNIFMGMGYINVFDSNLENNVYFEDTVDLKEIKVDTVLQSIEENLYEKNEVGNYVKVKGKAEKPGITGFVYTYKGETYCAGNETTYLDYTTEDIKNIFKNE